MSRVVAASFLLASFGCDRPMPWESTPTPVATPRPAEAVEPEEPDEEESAEEAPKVPLVLPPESAPAADRRDAAVRRSLDPGDCPTGTSVQGRSPPHGIEQYCARPDGVRFGPARAWPEDALPSSGGYMPGKNFRPVRAATYHDNQLHGPILTWGPTGLRTSLERYNVGVKVGIWASWNDKGQMVSQRNYFYGSAPLPPEIEAQTGDTWEFGTAYLYTEFFEDGKLSSQRIRLDEKRELLAGMRTWYKNGQLKCQADQIPERAPEHVLWVCYYEDGVKREEGGKRNGVRHGEWTEWARNGSMRTHGTYFEGKKTGTWEKMVRGKKKVQTYDTPIEQKLDELPKIWTQVFKAGKTVVLRPDCDGISRTITITGDHLILAAGVKSDSHQIESVTRDEDTWTLGLAKKQSIRVLYQGEGTAAIWKKPSKKLADAAGIYVPTSLVPKLQVQSPDCKTKKKGS